MAKGKSNREPIISRGPYTSPWARQTPIQPRTPLLDPREARKPWPLNPFTNPYLWPSTPATPSPSTVKGERGQIDEEVDFPNRWSESTPSQNPAFPKSLGCVTYTLPSSPSSPLSVGLFTTYHNPAFPTTYKALTKFFLRHCKIQRNANATIDAADRQTLLASSPFMVLRRYRSDIDKETESLKASVETEYQQVVAKWKAGEPQKLQRERAIKAGIYWSGDDSQKENSTTVGAQEMMEIEHAMMAFRNEQKNRHLCTVSTQLLDRDALIIDACQLWDALIVRGLITENEVSEEEVRGVFLVWNKVPKEAIVGYEPMAEKKELETGQNFESGNPRLETPIKETLQWPSNKDMVDEPSPARPYSKSSKSTNGLVPVIANSQITPIPETHESSRHTRKSDIKGLKEPATGENIATTKRKRNDPRVSDESSPITTSRKRAKATPSNTPTTRLSTRLHPTQSTPAPSSYPTPSTSIPEPNTPTTTTRKHYTAPKKPRKTRARHIPQDDQFAVADVVAHSWGFWKKKAGLFMRDSKGTLYREYLVKWEGEGEGYEDTWEPEPNVGSECLETYWSVHGPKPQGPPV